MRSRPGSRRSGSTGTSATPGGAIWPFMDALIDHPEHGGDPGQARVARRAHGRRLLPDDGEGRAGARDQGAGTAQLRRRRRHGDARHGRRDGDLRLRLDPLHGQGRYAGDLLQRLRGRGQRVPPGHQGQLDADAAGHRDRGAQPGLQARRPPAARARCSSSSRSTSSWPRSRGRSSRRGAGRSPRARAPTARAWSGASSWSPKPSGRSCSAAAARPMSPGQPTRFARWPSASRSRWRPRSPRRALLDETHPLSLGVVGRSGTPPAAEASRSGRPRGRRRRPVQRQPHEQLARREGLRHPDGRRSSRSTSTSPRSPATTRSRSAIAGRRRASSSRSSSRGSTQAGHRPGLARPGPKKHSRAGTPGATRSSRC